MIVKRLQNFLDQQGIKYQIIRHSKAYTGQEVAEAAQISGKLLAKTVILQIQGKPMLAVLPAAMEVNLEAIAGDLETNDVQLATEKECSDIFPHCEVGAWPPFGMLWDLPVLLDKSLAQQKHLIGYTGDLKELIRMEMKDFSRITEARVIPLASATRGDAILKKLFSTTL